MPETQGKLLQSVERVPVRALKDTPTLLDMREKKMVGDLAVTAHELGLAFEGWPKFERVKLVHEPESEAGLFGYREARLGEEPDVFELRGKVRAWPR
jgi:hypothetical protein